MQFCRNRLQNIVFGMNNELQTATENFFSYPHRVVQSANDTGLHDYSAIGNAKKSGTIFTK